MKTIAIIPARGGSKGIPRKNLRPMAGKPLIFYSIKTCLNSREIDCVVVTTDDEEIALFAGRFGAIVHMRPPELGGDSATLDPVVIDAVENISNDLDVDYDTVITVQPTSPLLTSKDVDLALARFSSSGNDTMVSVVEDRHLCWGVGKKGPFPKYEERVNRQYLPEQYKETGAFLICKKENFKSGKRIGESVGLSVVDYERSHDIDSFSDFYLCESLLKRKKIIFVVVGNREVGLGHAYRSVMIANELVHSDIEFIVGHDDNLAKDYIEGFNYRVASVESNQLNEAIIERSPTLVINDVLDTTEEYVGALKNQGIKVINFEDLGDGVAKADLVFNALYPTQLPFDHVYSGEDYFCLRDEFLHIRERKKEKGVRSVLLCFGGVDEGDITGKALEAIMPICERAGINVVAILGMGYENEEKLRDTVECFETVQVEIVKSTPRISDYMIQADVAITSGGRTVFELAAMSVPTIVVCQNRRELTHKFATSDNGVINLGYRKEVSGEDVASTFSSVIRNEDVRNLMIDKARQKDLSKGKARVISLINELLEKEGVGNENW